MRSERHSPRPFPRPAQPSAHTTRIERAKWREFLAVARTYGQAAKDGAGHDRDAVFDLQHHVFRTGKTPFPIEGAAARVMAKGFVEMAQALSGEAVTGWRREALGGAVRDLAGHLDAMIEQDLSDAFNATTGRQMKDN